MWYADEFLANPNLSATLYLNPGENKVAKHEKIVSGWLEMSETSLSVSHEWGGASNPVFQLSEKVAQVLNAGVSMSNAATQGIKYLTDKLGSVGDKVESALSGIFKATETQMAFVGASSFLKQYTGSSIELPGLTFRTVFFNDDWYHPIDVTDKNGKLSKLIDTILPKQFTIDGESMGLLARMEAPNGYTLPSDPSKGELKGSFLIAVKGLEKFEVTRNSELTGAMGTDESQFRPFKTVSNKNSSSKLISNLLLKEATVNKSNTLVATSAGLRPAYYIVQMDFMYGKPLLKDDFKKLL